VRLLYLSRINSQSLILTNVELMFSHLIKKWCENNHMAMVCKHQNQRIVSYQTHIVLLVNTF